MCRPTTACDSIRTQLPPLVVAFLKLATFECATDARTPPPPIDSEKFNFFCAKAAICIGRGSADSRGLPFQSPFGAVAANKKGIDAKRRCQNLFLGYVSLRLNACGA